MEQPERTDDSDQLNELVHRLLEEHPENEHHTSYGIGGAGNMKRRSEIEAAGEVLKNSPPDERKTSTWSMQSISTRRSSFVETVTSVFKKSNKGGETESKTTVEE